MLWCFGGICRILALEKPRAFVMKGSKMPLLRHSEVTVYHATTLPVNPILFRLVRIGKLARAIRMVTMTSMLQSLQLLVKRLICHNEVLDHFEILDQIALSYQAPARLPSSICRSKIWLAVDRSCHIPVRCLGLQHEHALLELLLADLRAMCCWTYSEYTLSRLPPGRNGRPRYPRGGYCGCWLRV